MQRRTKSLLTTEQLHLCRQQVSKGHAVLLAQGYPFTGFVLLRHDDRLCPPPGVEATVFDDMTLFWDIRVFGDLGEWHLWREDDGQWSGRLAEADDPSWRDHISRADVLWGLPVSSQDQDDVRWTLYVEKRGAAIWVPDPGTELKRLARLRLWQRVAYDSRTGLAGIVDAMLRKLDSTEGQHA